VVSWAGDTSSVSVVDCRMLCFGKEGFLRGITRGAEGVAWRSTPLLILMGKESEKHFKENEFFCFWGSEGARRVPMLDLGGSDPVSSFGRQNRTNTRVAPAQIGVFVCGLFSDRR
jgi:hypothetical protein